MRATHYRGNSRHQRRRLCRPWLEALEQRIVLSSTVLGHGQWTEQGPSPVLGGQTLGLDAQDNPVVGAVHSLQLHPVNPALAYLGSVNGGVWRTDNLNVNHPIWVSLTDELPTLGGQRQSLSVAALALNPYDATAGDTGDDILYVGAGQVSSASFSPPGKALLKTSDGGATWEAIAPALFGGLNVTSIVFGDHSNSVLVATERSGGRGGVFQTTDGGQTWTPLATGAVAKLPIAGASHLLADRNNDIYYAAVPGQGIFRSLLGSGGSLWETFNNGLAADDRTGSSRIKLALHSAGAPVLYAGLINSNGRLSNIYRTDNGIAWTAATQLPETTDNGTDYGLHPSGQGSKHFSIVADNRNPAIVYVGGDTQGSITNNQAGATDFVGRVFRGTFGATTEWEQLIADGASGTAPHADSREMVFVVDDVLGDYIIEVDDGGIYRLDNPRGEDQDADPMTVDQPVWAPRHGNLGLAEFGDHRLAYDPLNQRLLGGFQDIGAALQTAPGQLTWQTTISGDGNTQAVAVLDINQNGQTDPDDHVLHYVMGNNFAFFYRREFDANGQELSPPIPDNGPTLGVSVALAQPGASLRTQARFRENWAQALIYADSIETFNRGSFWSIPFVVNAVDPERLVLGSYSVYESHDRGEHIRIVDTLGKGQSYVSALAYGGRDPQAASGINRDVMYVARGSRVEVRHHLPPPGTKADSDDERFVAGRFFAADGTRLNGGPRSGISDLALDPDDWRRAFAVENSHIYMTEDGGRNWHDVTGSLADDQRHGLRTVEVVRHGGQLIVLVGGQGAVYRAFNPSPVTNPRPVWAAYGLSPPAGVAPLEHTPGLPGVQVMDLVYSSGLTADPADDVLLIGTAGRGAWAVGDVLGNSAAGGQLSQPGVLHVQGTPQDDVIRLALADDDPLTVEVFVNNDGFVADRRVPLISLHRIQVDGLGGDDDLVIDNSNGVLSLSGPVDYVDLAASFGNLDFSGGDGFDRVVVVGGGNVDLEQLDLGSLDGVLQISSQGRFQVLTASGTEMLDTTALGNPAGTPAGAVAELGSALQSLAIVLNQLDDADHGGALAGLGVDLPAALMGADIFEPDPISDARQVIPGGKPLRERKRSGVTAGISLLRRLIEEGPQGFRLAEIGSLALDTPQELAERLDALDDTPGNVFLVPDAPSGTTLLDVRIVRTLSGEGHIEAEALGGNLAVSGNAAVSARVSVHLLVGVDDQGFFLQTQPTNADGQVEPELVIDQIQATGSASGQLGFLEAELLDVSLVVDPQTRLEIDLRDPAAGTPEADGFLRVADLLNRSVGSLLSVTTYGDGPADGQPDVVLSGRVIPKLLAFDLPETLLAATWPDATDLANVQLDTTGPLAALRDLSLAEIRQTIDQLLVVVQQATGQDLRDVPLPLINKSVGELLDGPSRPLLIDDLDVDSITDVGTAESPEMFVEVTGIALGLRGVRTGQMVLYRDADGQSRQGTIGGLEAGGFLLAVPAGQPAPDPAAPGLEIQRAGVLATLIGTLQDGLSVELPTLQELIGALAELTGVDLLNNISVVNAGDGPVIQLPVSLDIEPYRYDLPLDFSGRLAGLSLDASAQLELEVEPAVALTLGISLAPGLEPAERFFLVTDEPGQPEFSLAVTARLNDPTVEGAFGFLNVNLAEDLPAGAPDDDPATPEDEDGNEGIELNLAVHVELTDPETGADSSGRLTLAELLAPDTGLADVFELGFAGFLDLDGLRIDASLGDSTALGNLRLSLRGEPEDDGGAGLPGQFTSASELIDVLTSIDVQGELTAFESFQSLNLQIILDMLDALGSELSKLGAGGVFETKLPLVNRSLNDLIDLGQAFADQFGDGGGQDLSTARQVEQFLNQKLDAAGLGALDVAVITTTEDIRFRVTLAGYFQESVPVSFQIGQQFGGLSLTGDGTIALAADAMLGLTFGVRTGQVPHILDRVFVDLAPADASDPAAQPELSVHVSAQAGYDLNDDGRFDEQEGSALTFQASIGPLQFAVDEARLRIDGTLGADFRLERPDGSLADDQRLTLRELGQIAVEPVFAATLEAIVPLDGPADADAQASPVPGSQSAADALVLVAGRLTDLVAPEFQFSQSLPFHTLDTPTAGNATDNNPATPLDVSDPLTAGELATLAKNTIVVGAYNVDQLVESTLINFGDLFANLDDLIAWGSELLGVDILNFKLPLIGKTLQDAFDFFDSPQGATLRGLVNDLIADPDTDGALVANLSNESVYDTALLLADVLRRLPGIKTIGDADRDGVIEADMVLFNNRLVLERGDDLVQLERDPDSTTEVLVSGGQFTVIDDDPDVVGADSLRIQLVGANFPRSGVAVDDVVRYLDARGEAATGRVARVENDALSGENNVLIVRLDDASRLPEANAEFTVDAHTDITSVTFALMFQPTVDAELFTVDGFDLGLDFLNFRATGAAGLSFHGDLTMLLGLGYQRGGEFFLKTDFSDLDTDVGRPGVQPPSLPEISLNGGIRAALDTQFELGFLNVGAELAPDANRLEAHLQVDLKGAAGRPNDPQAMVDDGRLTLTELLEYNFDQLQTLAEPSFTVEAHLDAALDASITPNFPSLTAHLALDWGDADATQADGFRPFHVFGATRPTPTLQLREIRLEAGQFIDRIARRVLERLDQFLPIPPIVVDALNAKIPLLKQTPVELLASFGVLDESDQRLLDFLISIVTLIERSEDLGNQTLGVNFDPVNLVPDSSDGSQPAVVIPATSSPIGRGEMDTTPNDEQLDDPPGAGLPLGIGNFMKDLADLGIVFPFLRLKDLAGVLVGKDVDLVFAQLPELDLANVDLIEKTIVIPPGIPILLEGSLSVSANLSAGFDTRGIRSGQLLDGFYLGDRRPGTNRTIEASDPEQQEFGFTGELTAGVGGSFNVGRFTIASASVGGGLTATVGIDLRDPNGDGKVHLDELQQLISSGGPLGFIEFQGCVQLKLFGQVTLLEQQAELDLTIPIIGCAGGGAGGGGGAVAPEIADQVVQEIIEVTGSFQARLDRIGQIIEILYEDSDEDPYDGDELLNTAADRLSFREIDLNLVQVGGRLVEEALASGLRPGSGVLYELDGRLMRGVVVRTSADSLAFLPQDPLAGLPRDGMFRVMSGRETLVVRVNGAEERFGPHETGSNFVADVLQLREIRVGTSLVGGLGPGNDYIEQDNLVRTPLVVDAGSGNDVLIAGGGSAVLRGGAGRDLLMAAEAPAALPPDQRARRGVRLEGGDGDDILIGGVADDVLLGGRGFDLLDAGAAFELVGGVAEPVLDSSGRDLLVGGGDSDFLDGRDHDDTLIGDYDAVFDPPPADAALRREGADLLQSLGVGQVRVFADNRGLSSDVHGPPALALRDARNAIAIADPRGVVFAEPEDDLKQGDSSGELKLDARGQTVTITDKTISLAGGRPLEFGGVQTIEVLNATGTVTIVGTPQYDTWTIRGDLPNYAFAGGPSVSLPGAASLVFAGGGGNDSLVLDYAAGNPLPGASLRFDGGARVGLPGNGIRILGTGGEAVELLAAGRLWGSGTLLLPDKSSLVFTDVEPLEVSQLGHFTLRTPAGADLVKVNPAATAGGAPANVVSGTASGFGMAEVLVSDVAELTIDVGQGDTPRDHDQIFVDSAGILARGLQHLSLLTGDGDDSLFWDSPTFETPDKGTVSFDAGPGRDTLRAGANADFTLDPSSLSSSAGGELQLSGLDGDIVQLSGGASANQFTIRDWSGSVLLDGQGLTDFVAATLTGGTLSTVDALQLTGTLITNAVSSSARVEGLLELPATRTFQVANGAAADDLVVSAVLNGAGGLTKQGAGLMRLLADNSYRGVTTVGAGTLLVLGSQPDSLVVVNQGTLGGTGRLGGTTVAGGVLAPGDNGAGILELQGGLTLEQSGTLALDVRGTLAGQAHDQLRVEGPVALGNGRLLVSSTFFLSGVGTSLTLIDNDRADSVQGTFAGLPEGALLNLNRRNFRISYRGGDGNDVTLTHVNTPSAFAQRMVTTPADENGVVLLTGMIVEEDPLDDFRLVIDWGDGSDVEQHLFPAGTIEVTLSHVYADNAIGGGNYVVDLDWRDPHGGGNHDQLLAQVNNVPPTVSIEAPTSGVRGQARLFEFQADDPSPVDQQGEFQWTVAWGDGSTSTFAGSSHVEQEHRYGQLGTYLVQAWAVDKDGGQSVASSRAIEIRAADLQDGVLLVGGTPARDVILVRPVDDTGTVSVRVNHLRLGEYRPAEIVVYAQDGHDTVILQSGRYAGKFVPLAVPAVLFGGEGHDRLLATGSVADNLLVGGGGQDLIRDGDGRDILLGGGDRDLLLASGGSDLLWGGWTPYDDDLPALRLLAAEWYRRDVPLADRQAHLRGALPGGANGAVLLNDAALEDDGQLDWLLGDGGEDWLLAGAGDVAPRRGRSGS